MPIGFLVGCDSLSKRSAQVQIAKDYAGLVMELDYKNLPERIAEAESGSKDYYDVLISADIIGRDINELAERGKALAARMSERDRKLLTKELITEHGFNPLLTQVLRAFSVQAEIDRIRVEGNDSN